jgi:hypothetical protein
MAKKPRVPPPPRPVQAPRHRPHGRRKEPRERSPRSLIAIAAVSLVVLVVAVAGFAFRLADGGSGGPQEALRTAGCSARTLPDQGATHLQSLEAKVKYKSFPPTSGRHYFQPAIFNAYNDAIDQKLALHNLEHGGVAIQYGNKVPRAQVDRLFDYWRDDPNGLLLAPLPQLSRQIALTAWTQLALCPSFNEDAFDAFLDAYRFKGPERLPPDALAPGQ